MSKSSEQRKAGRKSLRVIKMQNPPSNERHCSRCGKDYTGKRHWCS